MVRKCTVCEHPLLKKINKSLVEPNASFRSISQQYGLSKDSVRRHVDNGHIKEKIKKIQNAREAIEVDDLLTHIKNRRLRFGKMAEEAQTRGDPHLELKVYQVEGKFTEMECRVVGAFNKENNMEVKVTDARELLTRKLNSLASRKATDNPDQ